MSVQYYKGALRNSHFVWREDPTSDRFSHLKPMIRDVKVLKLYQLKISKLFKLLKLLKFLHKTKNEANPRIFDETFKTANHFQPAYFSKTSFEQPKIIAEPTSFAISCWRSYIWNNYLDDTEKFIPFVSIFLNTNQSELF